jgi:hypothetical protein
MLHLNAGDKFNGLIVLSEVGSNALGERTWLFRCDCGNEIVWSGTNVKTGQKKHCGCRNKRVSHGKEDKRLYAIHRGMKARCNYKNHKDYKDYGGRGIVICKEWMEYSTFKDWALQNGYRDDLQIDRRNNDNGYNPDNCRFVTCAENTRNTRRTINLMIGNTTMCLSEWDRLIDRSKGTAYRWYYAYGRKETERRIAALLVGAWLSRTKRGFLLYTSSTTRMKLRQLFAYSGLYLVVELFRIIPHKLAIKGNVVAFIVRPAATASRRTIAFLVNYLSVYCDC